MPTRLIRDGLKTSASTGKISEGAELLFVRLLLTVCNVGRYHAEPELVKQGALQNRPRTRLADVAARLDELEASGLISRYTAHANGAHYLFIPKFGQRLKFAVTSPFPAPPAGARDAPGQAFWDFGGVDPRPEIPEEEKRTNTRAAPVFERDGLWPVLADSCGLVPGELAARGANDCTQALKEILAASPDATKEEIQSRARRYKSVMPAGCRITPRALAKHWAACGESKSDRARCAAVTQIEPEPENWIGFVKDNYDAAAQERWGERAVLYQWEEMPADWRGRIARDMAADNWQRLTRGKYE